MLDYEFYIRYHADGVYYATHKERCVHYTIDKQITENGIKVVIHPKVKMQLECVTLTAKRVFKDHEKFFANGYQAWTTSREVKKSDKYKRLNQLYKVSEFVSTLATPSGDALFVEEEKGVGRFHGYTYTYIKNGDKLELFGSLSDRFAFTIFKVDMVEGVFEICKEVEGKEIESDTVLYDIAVINGGYDEVFDKYFSLMNTPKCRIDHMSGYTSWYNYYTKIDENIILRDLDGLDRAKDDVSIFQIDDGFQITTGEWLTNSKFPNGMKPIVEKIHQKGYKAGLWLAPFNVTKKSKVYKAHKDWVITHNGKPLLGAVPWGGAYTLDIYNEGARAYIKEIFNLVLNEWGFDMVKLDFLYSQCMYPRNNKTRAEIIYDAMDFLRECVGDKLLLGCGVPLAPCFGVVDACRISCDVSPNYKGGLVQYMNFSNEIVHAQNAITNTIFRRHLNGRAFVNDPDVFFMRDINIKFTEDQKLLLGFINNLCGDVLFVSDNAGDFSDEKIDILRRFFRKNPYKVYSADCIDDDGNYEIVFGNVSTKHTLRFNLKTGESNVREFLKD